MQGLENELRLEAIKTAFHQNQGSVHRGTLVRIVLKEERGFKPIPNHTIITGPIEAGYRIRELTGIYCGYAAGSVEEDPTLFFEHRDSRAVFTADCSEIEAYHVIETPKA